MTTDSDPGLDPRLRRFLSAVEALDADQWGRIEAASARLSSKDVLGLLDRSAYLGQAFSGLSGIGELLTVPAAAALQVGGWALGSLADGIRIVTGRSRPAPSASAFADELARIRLWRGGRAEPGRRHEDVMDALERSCRSALDSLGSADARRAADPSFLVLIGAALAVAYEHRLGPERAARLYEPVDSVIPWTSLDDPEAPEAREASDAPSPPGASGASGASGTPGASRDSWTSGGSGTSGVSGTSEADSSELPGIADDPPY